MLPVAKYIVNFTDPLSPSIDIPPKRDNGPGQIDSDTSLRLFGEGYTHWGEATNENFVRLLENFAGATAPINPVAGQLWVEIPLYYKAGSSYYVYDIDPQSVTYQTWGSISVTEQVTAPTATLGSYWFDTDTDTLYLFGSAYDLQVGTWMKRSHTTGAGVPVDAPTPSVKVYDALSNTWGLVASVLVTNATAAPADNKAGTLRFDPTTNTLYVWTGTIWSAIIDATNPVFTGNIDMGNNSITNLANATSAQDALNLQTGNSLYVNVDGDTMSGALVLNADPVVSLGAATKQYVDTYAAPTVHGHSLSDISDAGSAAAVDTGTLPTNVPLTSDVIGKQTIWIPVAAISPRGTNGAGPAVIEMPVNKISFKLLNFDPAVEEFAHVFVQMPKSWDRSTVTAKLVWIHSATTITYGVTWGVSAVAFSDGDSLDVPFGVEQTVTDVGGTTNVIYHTDITPAIEVGGTPITNDVVAFQISRKVADAGDTLSVDAGLMGMVLYYSTDTLNDA